jgi:hypothetical protein
MIEVNRANGKKIYRRKRVNMSDVVGITLASGDRCDACRGGRGRDCIVAKDFKDGDKCLCCIKRKVRCTWSSANGEAPVAKEKGKQKAKDVPAETPKTKRVRVDLENTVAGPSGSKSTSAFEDGLLAVLTDIRSSLDKMASASKNSAFYLKQLVERTDRVAEATESMEYKVEFWTDAMGPLIREATRVARERDLEGEESSEEDSDEVPEEELLEAGEEIEGVVEEIKEQEVRKASDKEKGKEV